jgi:Ribonuclease D
MFHIWGWIFFLSLYYCKNLNAFVLLQNNPCRRLFWASSSTPNRRSTSSRKKGRIPMPGWDSTSTTTTTTIATDNHSLQDSNHIQTQVWNSSNICTLLGMNRLHSRLEACGVKNYCFVNDHDDDNTASNRILPSCKDPSKNKRIELEQVPTMDGSTTIVKEVEEHDVVVHVKTLVWKGMYVPSFSKNHTRMQEPNTVMGLKNKDKTKDTFYFVTALRLEDKVDVNKLRDIVGKEEWPPCVDKSGTLILELAEQSCAEQMTGFQSGSMPPGWHTVPLKLFLDDSIVKGKDDTSSSCNNEERKKGNPEEEEMGKATVDENDVYSRCILSVGSGTSNYSLHVSLMDTLQSSIYMTNKDPNVVKHCTRTVCSFVRTKRPRQFEKSFLGENTAVSMMVPPKEEEDEEEEEENHVKPKLITRRLLHSTVKKQGKVEQVKAMLEQIGDEFPTFMNIEENREDGERFMSEYNKNALHYAAWKGDIETIALLIQTSKRYKEEIGGDVINAISKGMGCYGKTAIFYAITQCRDDVVLFLISHGANVLIVNNKGQTPSSLAVNKLKESTCQVIFQTEESQLKAGGEFANYRKSHSDQKRYGDLDPRFLETEDVNFDDDVKDDIHYYRKVVQMQDGEEKTTVFQQKPYLKFGIPNLFLPRSVRVTTPIWRRECYMALKREKEQRKAKVYTPTDNSLTVPQTKIRTSTGKNSIITLLDGSEIDMNLLPLLRLEDVLPPNPQSRTSWELVDSLAGIQILQDEIQQSMKHASEETIKDDLDSVIASTAWGLDCEWRPSHSVGEYHPVATLQLSSRHRAFVIDLISLCRHDVMGVNVPLTQTEEMLSDTLSMLFKNKGIRILGFGISQDLSKLSASYPHMPCFFMFHSVIDLHSLARRVYSRTPKNFISSLQKAVAVHFRKKLDKTEQCSEWDVRPLRQSQLEYASLDATILPLLLNEMITNNPSIERDGGKFLCKEHSLQMSFRFTHLEDVGNHSYKVEMGSIKTSYMDRRFARQAWPTFNKNPPDFPRKLSEQELQLARIKRPTKMDSNGATKKDTTKSDAPRNRKNAIELNQLTSDLSNLPNPGEMLGYTKDSCIARVLRNEVMDALPENSYLRYNRRGGVIEIGNAWLLFVNFGVGRTFHKYRNEFKDDGQLITFILQLNRYEDCALFQNLRIHEKSSMYRKHVLLFIRGSSNDKFLYCGSVRHHSHFDQEDLVNVVLQLDDFETLTSHTANPDDIPIYSQIVASQSSVYN